MEASPAVVNETKKKFVSITQKEKLSNEQTIVNLSLEQERCDDVYNVKKYVIACIPFSFVDIVTVILQLLLENIRDVDVYSDALVFTLPFGLRLLLFPLCKSIVLSL